MALFDTGGGNFLSDILARTNSLQPSFMEPAQPVYENALTRTFAPVQPNYDQIAQQSFDAGSSALETGLKNARRPSALSIIGGLADAFAELGGTPPMYQPTLDAARDRERQVEQDAFERDKFDLQKQKYGLDLQRGNIETAQAQNEMLGQAAAVLRRARDSGDITALTDIWGRLKGRLGLSPEQLAQADAEFQSNPNAFVDAMSAFADAGGGGNEFGLTPVIGADGRVWQLSKSGGAQEVQGIGPVTRGTRNVDRGNFIDVVDNLSGQVLYSHPKGSAPATGYAAVEDPNAPGGVSQMIVPGSEAERKIVNEADEKLSSYDAAITSLEPIDTYVNDLNASIEALKGTGALTGVDNQSWIGNLRALGYQNIPGIERTFNSEAGSARKTIDSITTVLATNFMNAMRKATDEGASSSARLLDTEKEVQRLKDSVTNAEDYRSAKDALDRFRAYVANQRAYLLEQRQKQAAKRSEVGGSQRRSPAAQPTSRAPTVSNW